MIDYIKGELTEINPAYAVVETGGIGYNIQIALPTYSAIQKEKQTKLYVFEAIREDAHILYGFLSQAERQLFLLLISVSGIGANTARMIMSSYSAQELQEMIASGNVAALNSIKGIGSKTAQRIIIDLKDKIVKVAGMGDVSSIQMSEANQTKDEAVAALVMLGFSAANSQKVIDKILKDQPDIQVANLIKIALKMM
ncbi:Holliday junction branch migration protein RuvA [Paludibacteraceae bacterium OttesenSCG-928-F17]|nr:Holliday junction branch migration protein RuvA [Paludibacteraceae bacterium OttesenSCG-928-F17]